MRKLLSPLFSSLRSPELQSATRRAEQISNQQRANLDGLEVSDSSWDEWVAAEAVAEAEAAERRIQPRYASIH